MATFTITTTGVNPSVPLPDLGMFNLVHPFTIDVLTKGNTLQEIQRSEDLHTAIINNWLTASFLGNTINSNNIGVIDTWVDSIISQVEVQSSSSNTFGSERHYVASEPVDTYYFWSSSIWIDKINQTWNLPAGKYRVNWTYNWNADTTSRDFQGVFLIDNNIVEEQQQEPKDSNGNWNSTGTDQKFGVSSFISDYQLAAGDHTFTIRWSASTTVTASIWGARIEIWRVE